MAKLVKAKRQMLKPVLSSLLLALLSCSGAAYAAAPVTQLEVGASTLASTASTDQSLTQPLTQQQNQIQYLQSQVAALAPLQQAISDLRGQNELLSHQVSHLELDIKLLTDRVVALEGDKKIKPPVINPVADTGAKSIANQTAVVSEEAAYAKAYNLINQNRYDEAISGFNQFVTQYPNGAHVPDANYWLGELYMIKGQPDQATQDFRKVILVKNSAHLPDALRQLGAIYLANGDSAHAKQMFSRVVSEFPGTSAASLAQKQLDGMN